MIAIILVAVLASAVSVYSAAATPTSKVAPNQVSLSQSVSVSVPLPSISQSASVSVPTPTVSQSVSASQSMSVSIGTSTQQQTTSMQTAQMTTLATTQQTSSVSVTAQGGTTTTTNTMTTVSPANCGSFGCYPFPPYPPYYPYPGYPAYGYPAYPYSGAYGGCSYSVDSSVSCYGYIYQAPNGCVELVVPVYSYYTGTYSIQYYTLHNLSSTPASGTWVTVTGAMYQGANTSSNGAACPGNYINVNTVTRY